MNRAFAVALALALLAGDAGALSGPKYQVDYLVRFESAAGTAAIQTTTDLIPRDSLSLISSCQPPLVLRQCVQICIEKAP